MANALDGVGRAAKALTDQARADNLDLGEIVAACAAVAAFVAHTFRIDPIDVLDEFRAVMLRYYDHAPDLGPSTKGKGS